jgi:hypothetical protein
VNGTRSWEKLAWTAFGLGLVYLAVSVYRLAFTAHEASTLISLLTDQPIDAPDRISSLQETESTLSNWALAALLGALGAYVFFLRKTQQALEEEGVDPREALRHWGLVVWRIAIWVNLLISLFVRASVSSGASADLAGVEDSIRHAALISEISLVARVVSTAALLVGILGLRARVRTRLAAAEGRRQTALLRQDAGAGLTE